jgi:hypothetical protein
MDIMDIEDSSFLKVYSNEWPRRSIIIVTLDEIGFSFA